MDHLIIEVTVPNIPIGATLESTGERIVAAIEKASWPSYADAKARVLTDEISTLCASRGARLDLWEQGLERKRELLEDAQAENAALRSGIAKLRDELREAPFARSIVEIVAVLEALLKTKETL
jgi:hypothetical protein